MALRFYCWPQSSPCRVVEMVANIVGVKLDKHYINLFDKEDPARKNYPNINPLHKVPYIVDGDFKLNESRAIMAYLVNTYQPNNEHIYPADPKKRAKIDELLYYDIGTFYSSAFRLIRPRFFGPISKWPEADEQVFKNSLSYLEKRLSDSQPCRFMLGDHLTIGDISLSASIPFIMAFGYKLSDYKHIMTYYENLRANIPRYSEINDEPCETLRKFIESRQQQTT